MEQASPLHLARLARVQQQMAALGLTQLLVTDPDSVWYLTGYDNEPLERMMVFCVRADGQHIFFLNRLFPAPASPWEQVWFSDTDDAVSALAARLDPAAPVGIDKTWSARFLLPLLERLPGCRPVLGSDCVDHCRACKDPAEQALMKEASRINDQVMTEAAAFFQEGVTEREAARFIEKRYTELGCSGPSFPTIVSFGAHGADPHHEPDDTPLAPGGFHRHRHGLPEEPLLLRHDPHLLLAGGQPRGPGRPRPGAGGEPKGRGADPPGGASL